MGAGSPTPMRAWSTSSACRSCPPERAGSPGRSPQMSGRPPASTPSGVIRPRRSTWSASAARSWSPPARRRGSPSATASRWQRRRWTLFGRAPRCSSSPPRRSPRTSCGLWPRCACASSCPSPTTGTAASMSARGPGATPTWCSPTQRCCTAGSFPITLAGRPSSCGFSTSWWTSSTCCADLRLARGARAAAAAAAVRRVRVEPHLRVHLCHHRQPAAAGRGPVRARRVRRAGRRVAPWRAPGGPVEPTPSRAHPSRGR